VVSYASSPGGVPPTFAFDDFHGNAGGFAGMGDPIGQGGNLALAPLFVNAPAGDFHLAPGSPLVDAGDPAVTDPDGSAADIGRYGGPDAD
jgi:hypothetical protein